MTRALVAWSTLLVISLGCQPKVEAPPRPSSAPKDATWAGGANGGAWIRCDQPLESPRNQCTVHDDAGAHRLTAVFERQGDSGSGAVTAVGFTGDSIILSDRSVLRATTRLCSEEH